MSKQWVRGIYLGREDVSGTHLVAVDVGVIQVRTVRRLQEEEQWNKETFIASGGHPWQMRVDPRGRGTARQRPHPHTIPIMVPPSPAAPGEAAAAVTPQPEMAGVVDHAGNQTPCGSTRCG